MTDAGQDLQFILEEQKNMEEIACNLHRQKSAIHMALDVLSALKSLHSIGHVHCDIKLENICGEFDADLKRLRYSLIDFGLV